MKLETLFTIYKEKLQSQYSKEEIHIIFVEVSAFILNKKSHIIKQSFAENNSKIAQNKWQFEMFLLELEKGKPLDYVLGFSEFYGRRFKVNSHVLIPRPETEELVEWIISDYKNTTKTLEIIDVGTGSGIIPITLAKQNIGANFTAIDVSDQAIEVAKFNAEMHFTTIEFKILDFLQFKECKQEFKKYDVLVSNPPYIRKQDFVAQDVNSFEPHLALYVEENPLIFYEKIIDFAKDFLTKEGCVYVEINQYLAQETLALFQKFFSNVILKKDISGNPRMIQAKSIKQ